MSSETSRFFFHSITWIVPGRKLGSSNGDRINGVFQWVYNPLILGYIYPIKKELNVYFQEMG